MLVPPEESGELITAHFLKMSVLIKGRDGEMVKRLQQAHRLLRSPEAGATYDGEGKEAPDCFQCQLKN